MIVMDHPFVTILKEIQTQVWQMEEEWFPFCCATCAQNVKEVITSQGYEEVISSK